MSLGIRVGLVTCRALPEPDPDEPLLLERLRQEGLVAELPAWDDPEVDWARFSLCVVRSTWNYVHHLPAFLAWVERVGQATRLLNPPDVIHWNAHKGYLRSLKERNVAIIPTVWLADPSRELDLVRREHGWGDVVVKPAVSAGSFNTHRVRGGQAVPHLARGDWMVQPYVKSVEGHGERALVWIDGELTHSVRKSPRLAGDAEVVSSAEPIAKDERRFAEKVLQSAPSGLLYARVDVARSDEGALQVMELELIEPSLFLVQSPHALEQFVRAIVQRARVVSAS